MKIAQVSIFSIAVALFVGSCFVIWEFFHCVNLEINPHDRVDSLDYLGIYIGIVLNLVACAILIPINLFLGKHKDKIFHSLYLSTNMLLVLDGAFLIIMYPFL